MTASFYSQRADHQCWGVVSLWHPLHHKNHSQTSATYFGLVVLQPVGFIHHQTGPLYGAQHRLVNSDQLIGGEQDMELDLGFLLEEQRERKPG